MLLPSTKIIIICRLLRHLWKTYLYIYIHQGETLQKHVSIRLKNPYMVNCSAFGGIRRLLWGSSTKRTLFQHQWTHSMFIWIICRLFRFFNPNIFLLFYYIHLPFLSQIVLIIEWIVIFIKLSYQNKLPDVYFLYIMKHFKRETPIARST